MNVKEIISSGLLERYLAGQTSQKETKKLEFYRSVYPEIDQQIEHLQDVLQQIAIINARVPDRIIKTRLMQQLDLIKEEEE